MISLLDYGAGNVRSVRNAIARCGFDVVDVTSPSQILEAEVLIFPGVGSFGKCMEFLHDKGFMEPLKQYLKDDRPFLGICLGMQTLFEASEETEGVRGLGVIPGTVERFQVPSLSVPHIGWNNVTLAKPSQLLEGVDAEDAVYFVHSFRAMPSEANKDWVLCCTDYGETYISAVQHGRVTATQFHPEKSGRVGLTILGNFLRRSKQPAPSQDTALGLQPYTSSTTKSNLRKRVIACLDVRANDQGDLVVTKGDQYEVREASAQVRNLGKPVELAGRYFEEGADEITFLNITGFRDCPLQDLPMLQVLEECSKNIFVPLTVGGGIKNFTDGDGREHSALEVAGAYFRAGADKVSIGSDAVEAVRDYLKTGQLTGMTAIEQISEVYGRQAVVISIDPRRRWVKDEAAANGHTLVTAAESDRGPNGEHLCWYECTIHGGRSGSDIDATQLARVCEKLGAGEILLNCIDKDGQNNGFDIPLVQSVAAAVSVPVIASSGAGCPEHFSQVFQQTRVEAALAAGIFHRAEVPISSVKTHLQEKGLPTRM